MSSVESFMPKSSLKLSELRNRVLIGEIPDDFLRISYPTANVDGLQEQGAFSEQQPAYYPTLSAAEHFYSFVPPHTRGRLAVKIVEAKLSKNYGLPGVRMDPYVRLRIGNTLFETPTCVNGGKEPHWNRTVNAYLPNGVESIYLQIFDERAFTSDELVAWSHIMLPQGIFNQEVIDEWYQLSGPQGEGKEGVVNLVISFAPVPRPPQQQTISESEATAVDVIAAENAGIIYTEEELNELQEMFPNIEREVIKQILEANGGNKDSSVTTLIELNK